VSDIGLSNAAAEVGRRLMMRHFASGPRPADGQAVLGQNASDLPGDCDRTRLSIRN
jgi:hypothetical protein